MDIEFADVDRLAEACDGSWYFIAGCGDPLEEWVTGYEEWMEQNGGGKPIAWYRTNGAPVNSFAVKKKGTPYLHLKDLFPGDLTCLLFPLDGLDIGRLAMFKLGMQDRWFDDVIMNMRRLEEEDDD